MAARSFEALVAGFSGALGGETRVSSFVSAPAIVIEPRYDAVNYTSVAEGGFSGAVGFNIVGNVGGATFVIAGLSSISGEATAQVTTGDVTGLSRAKPWEVIFDVTAGVGTSSFVRVYANGRY